MSTRLVIDAARCTGHGRCYAMAPDLLSDDEEGFVAQRGSDEVDVPAGLLGQADEAEQACPERAVRVLRSSAPSAGRSRPS
ncbi:ferredoxin [Streptomyces spongiae]|uniref:ferredoxin n=1 Tax=Streptomyces spongiae TaxID=565072 RepID=UPI002AD24275|nr:ferredoxin [Streptomyces spongiae]